MKKVLSYSKLNSQSLLMLPDFTLRGTKDMFNKMLKEKPTGAFGVSTWSSANSGANSAS